MKFKKQLLALCLATCSLSVMAAVEQNQIVEHTPTPGSSVFYQGTKDVQRLGLSVAARAAEKEFDSLDKLLQKRFDLLAKLDKDPVHSEYQQELKETESQLIELTKDLFPLLTEGYGLANIAHDNNKNTVGNSFAKLREAASEDNKDKNYLPVFDVIKNIREINLTNIVALSKQVSQLILPVLDNQFATERNEREIILNAESIKDNMVRINGTNQQLQKLSKKIDGSIATQAALAGLFQPYKLRAVNFTAALGGYKTQVALAAGAGYRFNESISTKAGLVYNFGGALSYSATLSYLF